MGDKSPKSMRKQADQKQSKTDGDNRKKQDRQAGRAEEEVAATILPGEPESRADA
jgi:hypothetical protein